MDLQAVLMGSLSMPTPKPEAYRRHQNRQQYAQKSKRHAWQDSPACLAHEVLSLFNPEPEAYRRYHNSRQYSSKYEKSKRHAWQDSAAALLMRSLSLFNV